MRINLDRATRCYIVRDPGASAAPPSLLCATRLAAENLAREYARIHDNKPEIVELVLFAAVSGVYEERASHAQHAKTQGQEAVQQPSAGA